MNVPLSKQLWWSYPFTPGRVGLQQTNPVKVSFLGQETWQWPLQWSEPDPSLWISNIIFCLQVTWFFSWHNPAMHPQNETWHHRAIPKQAPLFFLASHSLACKIRQLVVNLSAFFSRRRMEHTSVFGCLTFNCGKSTPWIIVLNNHLPKLMARPVLFHYLSALGWLLPSLLRVVVFWHKHPPPLYLSSLGLSLSGRQLQVVQARGRC